MLLLVLTADTPDETLDRLNRPVPDDRTIARAGLEGFINYLRHFSSIPFLRKLFRKGGVHVSGLKNKSMFLDLQHDGYSGRPLTFFLLASHFGKCPLLSLTG